MRSLRDVLAVEDESVVLHAIGRILGLEGLSVDRAVDVQTALAELDASEYRLVLCDLMLPGARGFELLDHVRHNSPRTPVITITGWATVGNALEAFRRGAFDFIPKPFDVGELLGVARRSLGFYELGGREWTPGRGTDPLYSLGQHSWARLHPDGSATLGLAETFPGLTGDIDSMQLPEANEHVTQGKCLLRITGPEKIVHRVWAPLSGRIIAVNPKLVRSHELLETAPFLEGWLVRIIPENLDNELATLTRRSRHPAGGG